MKLFYEVLISVLLCVLIFALVYSVKRILLTPMHPGAGEKIFFVVSASGDAPNLQHTVSGLRLLSDESGGVAHIIVADAGLTPEARRLAGLVCLRDGKASLVRAEDLPEAVR